MHPDIPLEVREIQLEEIKKTIAQIEDERAKEFLSHAMANDVEGDVDSVPAQPSIWQSQASIKNLNMQSENIKSESLNLSDNPSKQDDKEGKEK